MLVWHLSEGATAMSDPETTAYWPATTEAAVLNTSIGGLLRDAVAAASSEPDLISCGSTPPLGFGAVIPSLRRFGEYVRSLAG